MKVRAKGRLASEAIKPSANSTSVIIDLYGDHEKTLGALGDKLLDIELREHRDRRSLRANALCWELCSQIGLAISPPLPKEEVYRQAIRDVGVFIQLALSRKDYRAFDEQWSARGAGWFTEATDTDELLDTVEVMAYCGSSAYDSKAMSVLIDYLVDQAEQMELQIAYDLQEIEKIKEDWAHGIL